VDPSGHHRAIADHSRTIRIPVHMVETLTAFARQPQHGQRDGSEPTPEELAQRTGVAGQEGAGSSSSRRASRCRWRRPIGEDSELGDFLEDKSAGSPNDTLMGQDLTTQVERRAATLSPKEKEILRLRFGIGEEGEHTLEEVGKALRGDARAHPADEARRSAAAPPMRGRNREALADLFERVLPLFADANRRRRISFPSATAWPARARPGS